MKILVIDDEQLDLFINKKILGLEFDVEGFTTLGETLAWAEHHDFDIALIDYYLGPGVHAHDAYKALVSLKGNTFKAYVLSNYIDQKQSQEILASGFVDIIYKPLTIELFKSKLNIS